MEMVLQMENVLNAGVEDILQGNAIKEEAQRKDLIQGLDQDQDQGQDQVQEEIQGI